MLKYFNCHSHTEFSNIRLVDSINKPEELIDKAIEIGLSGIAITDHESLSAHVKVNKYAKKIRETNPDFTVALGNEIYLTDSRESGQKYFHFILIAKDAIGYKALKELSSIAWYNMYSDRGVERVPTLKSELIEIIHKYPGHLIATSACMGGELSTLALNFHNALNVNDTETARYYNDKILDFMQLMKDLFGTDFYIEVAPSTYLDQIVVNQRLRNIAKFCEVPIVVGTDAHYLAKEDRWVHKSFLNSKNGDREVDSFYEFARLMDIEECKDLLMLSFENEDYVDDIFQNTLNMQQKIQFYSLEKPQSVTEIEVKDYPKTLSYFGVNNDLRDDLDNNYPILKSLLLSDNIQERYWVNQCLEALIEKNLFHDDRYLIRLNEEARVKRVIGEKLGTNMFAYPNTLQHYIDLFWECGSTVGAGRGSACSALNHYLLGITQLDPIQWNLPFWRYLNDERVELGDVDIDLAPSKLQLIFEKIREERGELGITQICTFGTEGTKSAILTACRGYRSEDYPDGIDNDEAQYLSSLVPIERGFQWSLKEMLYGNPEKDRKPQTTFINAMKQYDGLIEIVAGIEGLVSRRGSHASGVIFFNEDIYEDAAIMRTPSGAIVTQWDLHDSEACGCVKYDFLLTNVQDIIIQTIELLQKDNVIEQDLSLREIYNKYLHPAVLPTDDKKMWDALANNEVICCFQFDSDVGAQAAKKIRPQSPLEMSDANGLMRLMTAEKGEETPLEKYVRFKNDISLWYNEMEKYGLSNKEQETLVPYFLPSYGVPPSQEQMMMMLMDEDICGFSLAEANAARKIVGKKQMDKIPDLQRKVIAQAKSPALGSYVWKFGIGPQMGYAFSTIHALAYSFIGMQTLYLATNFNPIYWNTACLIVNSGSLDEEKDESTNYTKLAKAIGEIRSAGIEVSLADINNSDFGFVADAKHNKILFGLKGLLNVGNDVVTNTIANRPYVSPKDFLQKVKPNKQAMISLIKGGAFDELMDRKECMVWYIWETCDKKKNLTLQNMGALIKYDLLPKENEEQVMAKRIYEFNRYLKTVCKKSPEQYQVDERATNFLIEIDKETLIAADGSMLAKDWDKVYQSWMDVFRAWIAANKQDILQKLNTIIFKEDWDKYASGNYSSWEMEVLCFYYHEHELSHIKKELYGLVDFIDLPEEPVVDRIIYKKDNPIPLFKLEKICGTCIAKNKTKGIVTLLTPTGVVDVKFRKEYFSLFDKQISERNLDGTKKIVEKSWFNRGNMIVVMGIRRGDIFIPKKYNSSNGHQLYKIDKILPNGELILQSERYQGDIEE